MSDRRTVRKGLSALPMAALAGTAHAQSQPLKLNAMLGDYSHSHALHTGAVKSSSLALDLAPVKVPSTAFARHNIEIVIDYAFRTGMIPKRFAVDKLFNDVTATLA
jgi:hypothetical protein